ncbi:transmembrane protein 98 isoform X3 [Pongo abelii]|uniref:transmembrane protein 98 isoform X3 n=1 Tax=Pongo abelii TaxID=9601 RepID=UPI0030041595
MGQSVAEHTGSAASPPAEPIGARRLGPPARGGAQAGTLRSPLRLPPGWATGGARKGCWVARARLPAAPAAGGPGGDGGAWRRGFGAGRGPGAGAGARGRGAGFLGPRRFPACSAAGPRPRPDFAIGGAVAGCAREPQPEALRSLQVSWRNLAAAILSPSLPLPAGPLWTSLVPWRPSLSPLSWNWTMSLSPTPTLRPFWRMKTGSKMPRVSCPTALPS